MNKKSYPLRTDGASLRRDNKPTPKWAWLGSRDLILFVVVVDLHQTESVGAGSDHLQLVKFWRSHTKGGLQWGEMHKCKKLRDKVVTDLFCAIFICQFFGFKPTLISEFI